MTRYAAPPGEVSASNQESVKRVSAKNFQPVKRLKPMPPLKKPQKKVSVKK